MFQSANEEQFLLKLSGTALPLRVTEFSGTEYLSDLYRFQVKFVALGNTLDFGAVVGQPGLLTLRDPMRGDRYVHGEVIDLQQQGTGTRFTHYVAVIAPKIWYLTEMTDHRIFQHLSVPEILEQVLIERQFTHAEFKITCILPHPKREYCVQYGETTFHFLSRLMEEEGIHYHFEHSAEGHVFVAGDTSAVNGDITPDPLLHVVSETGMVADMRVIKSFAVSHKVTRGKVAFREYNFTKPAMDLARTETAMCGDARQDYHQLETYTFPHLYQLQSEGDRYVKLEEERQQTFRVTAAGTSDCPHLTAGCMFTLAGHGRPDFNAMYLLTAVSHFGAQPQVLEEEAPSREGGSHYENSFAAIPGETVFRPPLRHSKVRIEGVQSAVVTGPAGEEIYVDEFGRVKVQFFWDRLGKHDEKTTCWVRVSHGSAGGSYGTVVLPRVGHEVLVEFMEGDPDRPVITGRVFNAKSIEPYALPANKTRSLFKTVSYPGGQGFNELRIEDKKNNEQIYMHAQKDVDIDVLHNWTDTIGNERSETTVSHTYLTTGGETHELMVKDRMTLLNANEHLTIQGSSDALVNGNCLLHTDHHIGVTSGTTITINAGDQLVLHAGGSFITINANGVTVEGAKIDLNCGASKPDLNPDANPTPPAQARK